MIEPLNIVARAATRNLAVIGALLLAAPGPAAERDDLGIELEAIRAADMQLATAGFRLSVAAAALCDRREPGTGLQLHAIDQYPSAARDRIRTHFGLSAPVGIEGVVPGSPAERAGVRADDAIVRIGGIVPAETSGEMTTATLAGLHAQLAGLSPSDPISLTVRRQKVEHDLTIAPVPACRTRYELRIANAFDARANGELIQITSRYLEDTPAELFPAVVAHELAHNILRHRERLSAAGAEFGVASGLGRNVGLFRQTEIEADILSVHLLARAGYAPEIAERFWREIGPKLLEGKIRSRSHPRFQDRAATVAAEAARIAAAGADAPLPGFYARRGQPLDANWQVLLVKGR
jgi:hypothetical protein